MMATAGNELISAAARDTTRRWRNVRLGLGCVAGGGALVGCAWLLHRGIALFCAQHGVLPVHILAVVLFFVAPFALHFAANRGKRLTERWLVFYLYYSAGIASGLWFAAVPPQTGPIGPMDFLLQTVGQLLVWPYLFGMVVVLVWAQSGDVPANPPALPPAGADPTPLCDHCGSEHTDYIGESGETGEAQWRCRDCGYEFSTAGQTC
jgi:hypothetical protein